MTIELKPCPFCNGKAEMMGITFVYVKCLNCGVETMGYKEEEDAAFAWNRRDGENHDT